MLLVILRYEVLEKAVYEAKVRCANIRSIPEKQLGNPQGKSYQSLRPLAQSLRLGFPMRHYDLTPSTTLGNIASPFQFLQWCTSTSLEHKVNNAIQYARVTLTQSMFDARKNDIKPFYLSEILALRVWE